MPVLVVIAGPQASGKSTIASALGSTLRGRGERVAVGELDAIAAMALPTLPSWEAAHEIFATVTGLWARTDLTWVVAEGGGSGEEVESVLRTAPPGDVATTVAVTTSFASAYARAQADPTRGVSKDHDYLRGIYDRWPAELARIAPDVLLDTDRLDVGECVAQIMLESEKRQAAR